MGIVRPDAGVSGQFQKAAEKMRQVSAGDADALGVDVMLGGVGTRPAHGCLDVVDRGRKGILRRQSVGDGQGDVAVLSKPNALKGRN